MGKYKNYIIEKLDEYVSTLCGEIMEKENVTHGDTYPEQAFALEMLYEDIAEIVLEIVEQNMEV